MKKKHKAFLIFFTLLLAGCGYRWGYEAQELCCETLSIPFIGGDTNGAFTEELIYQICSSGLFRYEPHSARYLLEVQLGGLVVDQIGYRRDVESDGSLKKNILPTESREKVAAQVSLIDTTTQEKIWGPYGISADVDFDYLTQHTVNDLSFIDSTGNRIPVLWFSMGQLEPSASAQEAAKNPLYRLLAKKIVDALRAR